MKMISGLSSEAVNDIVDDQSLIRLQNASDDNVIFITLEEDNNMTENVTSWIKSRTILKENSDCNRAKLCAKVAIFPKKHGKSDKKCVSLNWIILKRLSIHSYRGWEVSRIRDLHCFTFGLQYIGSWQQCQQTSFQTQISSPQIMLKANIAEWLKMGNIMKHFDAIEFEDQHKLMNYFNQSTPKILPQEMSYDVIYHLGNRGSEEMKDLCPDDIRFAFDWEGKRSNRRTRNIIIASLLNILTPGSRQQCRQMMEILIVL